MGRKATAKKKAPAKKKVSTTKRQAVAKKGSGSWYKRGSEGLDRKRVIDKNAATKKEKSAQRFWMKGGTEAKVIVVDDAPFYITEHNIEMDGRWGNYFTCTKDHLGACRICQDGKKGTYTAYITIIDTRPYKRKSDDTVVGPRRVLLPLKGSAINFFDDLKKDARGGLKGMILETKRYTSDDPNCGNVFKKLRKVKASEVEKIGKRHFKVFDYEKVLAPPTEEELSSIGLGDIVDSPDTVLPESGDTETEEDLSDLFS